MEGEKGRGVQITHHESIPGVVSGGGRPEKRINGGAKLQEAPMVTGGGWSDSGRGEAGLGVGEGGGGAGESSRARNQSMVAGGGRSTEGGDGGASARAELVTGRRMMKRKEDMIGGSYN